MNYLWNQRTLADLEQSIDYYQQAILLAPDFAPACAALGDVYAVISIRGGPRLRNPIPERGMPPRKLCSSTIHSPMLMLC